MYGEDKELKLYPYTLAEPHGTSQYACNHLPPDLSRGWIRGFDPSKHSPQSRRATIEINELLSGGDDSKGQTLACSATKFVVGKNEDGSSKFRCVGLILMEYLYGASITMIYATPEETENGKNGLKVNLALRKAVIRMVIRGIVLHSHVGVKTVFVLPENIFVTAYKDPLGNLRQAYCGEEFDEKGEFIKWLADEFGPLVEGQNDKGEYYSTYDTLNAIIEKLNKEEAEKAEALEKAQPDTTEV
ncbi:hypothetical protein CPLU01_08431 [Colletotrichum plurivorum]|uniref:Uncharacterized protein n=1 Tax=Colletotrichum plurivorum TaxID=2175906 RepID=A0A8H6KBV2_9PEZI|nr:hypothetical protein CPLU01_08431 [Colletotrichum plurivorum]